MPSALHGKLRLVLDLIRLVAHSPPMSTFAGYPAPFVRDTPDGTKKQQLIWGDFVTLLGDEQGEWTRVHSRRETGWMKKSELQSERLLEIGFVDIGQGDGAFLVTPNDTFMLIDAGESDNMFRFLSWRFDLRDHPTRVITIPHAVITHSDQDHYKGYSPLFASTQFKFETVYHNGLVERAGADLLGPRTQSQGSRFLTDVITDLPTLQPRLADPAFVGSKQYPRMLKAGLDSGRVTTIRSLHSGDQFVPGFDRTNELRIEVIGPVRETVNGQHCLRWFTDDGPTKNGHSVVLRLVYRDIRILMGGDLNTQAESHLLRQHTGLDPAPATEAATTAVLTAARPIFEADVAKACHHGSADFSDLFLRAVNPLATIISSGDNEPHAHPRPDALGAYGKFGRGRRPLIFSTELARSANENIKDPQRLRKEISDLFAAREAASLADRPSVQEKIDDCLAKLERSVAVYGMINLRTDGHKVLLAQKLERPRPTTREEWDVHLLEKNAGGELVFVED
jgi:beta-lactamase superfamily II metal-dependent hydrolase